MHIGVDADSGLVHSVQVSAANDSDVAHGHELLHGDEQRVHSDAGYTGLDKRDEIKQAQEQGRLGEKLTWHIAAKRGVVKAMADGPLKVLIEMLERKKAQMRAIVEHPFHVIKNLFRYRKVSYRGMAKNAVRAYAHAALANLVIAKRALLHEGRSAS
jgi:transposase, IS5 family